ncbi:MAG: hypothetical protein CMF39_01580 [Legionellaceae bacterium]|nr:hypothetical protein [Legionellaceae bacterium]|tara:strand:+ start:443 stop:1117 length:675 start_codon:yes stop_codon:yes gene_type:complete
MSKKHYLQKTCPTGSTLYYSLLYQSSEKREAMILIEAFYQAIISIIKISELSVAQAKLQWWREEINRMFVQQGEHPISKSLQTHLKTFNLSKNYFLEITNGVLHYLANTPSHDDQSAYQFYCQTAGSRELLKASMIEKINPSQIKVIYQSTAGISIIEDFQLAKQLFKKPLDSAEKFLQNKHLPQPLCIRADIALAILRKMRKHQGKSVDILPLRKLFIAWKNK